MTCEKKLDARQLDRTTLEAMRFRAVEAARAGMKPDALALAYGVSRRTIFQWLADFRSGGEQALKVGPVVLFSQSVPLRRDVNLLSKKLVK